MTSSLLYLLDHEEHRQYNVSIARKLNSKNAAIFLCELINRHRYHEKNNELIKCPSGTEGWFYYTAEKGEERLFMSEKELRPASKILVAWGLIEKIGFGVPNRNHFRLNINEIEKFLMSCSANPVTPKGRTGYSQRPNSTYIEDNHIRDDDDDMRARARETCGNVHNFNSVESQGLSGSLHQVLPTQDLNHHKKPISSSPPVAAAPPSPNASISQLKAQGERFTISDLYRLSCVNKMDWTVSEIEIAYAKYKLVTYDITHPFEYISSIIENERVRQKESTPKKTNRKNNKKQKELPEPSISNVMNVSAPTEQSILNEFKATDVYDEEKVKSLLNSEGYNIFVSSKALKNLENVEINDKFLILLREECKKIKEKR